MPNKSNTLLSAFMLLLALSACLPQTGAEPEVAESTLETLATSHVPLDETLSTANLEPAGDATPSPIREEPVMENEPPTKQPARPESTAEVQDGRTAPTPLSPTVQNLVDQAKADLALRLAVPVETIEMLSFEEKVWSDAGLGCPQPGMRYRQVPVEGYLIRLQVGDQIYDYHGGNGRGPFLCEQPGPQIVITKQAPFDLKQTPTISVPPPRD